MKLEWFSLPNLLANENLVPELLQNDVSVEHIVPLVKERLYQDQSQLDNAFMSIHKMLKLNASEQAAEAVVSLLP